MNIFLFLVFCSQDIYVFVLMNPQISKFMTSSYCTSKVTFSNYFFRILGSIKMKLGQIFQQRMIKILDMFLTLLQRLETSSRSVYDFHKMAI